MSNRNLEHAFGIAFAVACAVWPVAARAQDSEVIRGRVLDTEGRPLASVEVTVTGQDGSTQRVLSDAKGEYSAVFRDGKGTYALLFRKVGFAGFARSVRRDGLSSIIEVPAATLVEQVNKLQPIVVRERRLVPTSGERRSLGGIELSSLHGELFTVAPGDLNELAALLPGVFAVGDSGYSVLGAPPSQNRVVVDGAEFGSTRLPRDAIAASRVVTSTFDPSKGRFAGGSTVVTTRAGSDHFAGMMRPQFQDPRLAWAYPESPTPVPQTVGFSGYLSGPLGRSRATYFGAWDLSRRSVATPSLSTASSSLLGQYGVAEDSVAALASSLTRLGIPQTVPAIPVNPVTIRATGNLRADLHVNPVTSLMVSVLGDRVDRDGSGVTVLAFPVSSVRSITSTVRSLASLSTYFRRFLDELRVSWSRATSDITPYVELPAATVQLGLVFADQRTGTGYLGFGGSSSNVARSTSDAVDAVNEVSWATPDATHQLKFTQELRRDWGAETHQASQFGAYQYASLADLADNRPAAYQRVFAPGGWAYSATTAALSLGDIWRAVPGILEFQGGVRLDATAFGTKPAYNAAVDSAFGVVTSRVPAEVDLSPRLGVAWTPGVHRRGGLPEGMTFLTASGLPTSARGTNAPLDAAGVALGGPRKIAGGVGAYRGIISPRRIGALAATTGLPDGTSVLSCVGTATPIPDWRTIAEGAPTTCADNTGATPYAAEQARVDVFAPSFHAPVSWRGDLSVTGFSVARWPLSLQASYSVGLDAESTVDLNLLRTAAFVLPSEGNRPVLAPTGAIVPSTGLFSAGGSRVLSDFGVVTQRRSDLRYQAAQVIFAIAPPKPLFGKVPLYLDYVWNTGSIDQRGFEGTTAGDPFVIEHVARAQPTHQFIIGATDMRLGWFTAAIRITVQSGTAFTPVVAQDINGDGRANDRAFVPVPATIAGTILGAQFSTLLAGAPTAARECLERQFGTIAAANSCRSPWQGRFDLNLAFTPPQGMTLGDRLRLSATLLNAGGAVVRLLGLSNTPFGRMQATAPTDSRLLNVTGFDPDAHQFKYRVNQLFGQPLDYGSSQHRYPPFEVVVGLQYRLGYPPTAPTARRLGVYPAGGGSAAVASQVRETLLQSFGGNPVIALLQWRDSLELTSEQVLSIEAVSHEFQQRADSLLAPIVAYAVRQGKRLTLDDLSTRTRAIGDVMQLVRRASRVQAEAFLLPGQRETLARLMDRS